MNQCQMLGLLYPILFLQNTHIMSAEECIMAADFQNQFPNPCSLSGTGYFGSKFVTVCVSGNETNQISLKGYQVCTSIMAQCTAHTSLPMVCLPGPNIKGLGSRLGYMTVFSVISHLLLLTLLCGLWLEYEHTLEVNYNFSNQECLGTLDLSLIHYFHSDCTVSKILIVAKIVTNCGWGQMEAVQFACQRPSWSLG